jgi:hypothetical protein
MKEKKKENKPIVTTLITIGDFHGRKNGNNSVDQTYQSRQKEKRKNAKKSPKTKTLHRECIRRTNARGQVVDVHSVAAVQK